MSTFLTIYHDVQCRHRLHTDSGDTWVRRAELDQELVWECNRVDRGCMGVSWAHTVHFHGIVDNEIRRALVVFWPSRNADTLSCSTHHRVFQERRRYPWCTL